jgi:polysaccharide biosynthesis transport protein
MTLSQLLLILRARIWSVLIIFVLAVSGTLAVSLWLPKKYTATATIVIDVRSPDPILGAILPGLVGTGYMTTQIDILTSNKVAMQVVKDLQLDMNPTAREQYMEATDGQGPIELWLARALQRYLQVKPSRDSNVLEINYTGVDPAFAAVIANAFAKAYIDTSLAMRVEPARQYASWFDSQIKTLRENLEKAQGNLSAFQQKAGIVATDERIDIESARLAELSTQVVGLQAQSADSRSRQNQARGSVDTMQEVLSHPLIQGLKGDVARHGAKLQDLRAQLGKNHPQVERAEAELQSLSEKLDIEMKKIITGITTTNQVNQQREVEIRRSLEAQRAKVMSMKAQRDEQSVLVRDVESAQRAFDAVSNRLTQTTLESQTSQTNIYLLSPAVEPNSHSRPRVGLNVAASIVLGLMLGIGLAVGRELLDRRVRSEVDLVQVFEMPVLANIDRDVRGTGRQRLLGHSKRRQLPSPA